MAITNPSFETALSLFGIDRPGMPDAWFVSNGGSSWEWAVFNSLMFIGEDFEIGWSGNEGRRTVFGGGELDYAIFDVTIPESFEDFEEEWGGNEGRRTVFAAGQLDNASIDAGVPEAFEDFEEEWGGNEGRRTVFGGGELDDSTFDSGAPEIFEDFEEEWDGNEGRRTVFGGGELDDAFFQVGVGTGSVERCGDDTKDLNVPAGVAIGAYAALDISQPNRIAFAGTLTGTLLLQVQRDGFATWETYETITAVPVSVSLPAGYKTVRIERTVSGGTTTAAICWPVLTNL